MKDDQFKNQINEITEQLNKIVEEQKLRIQEISNLKQ